MSNPPAGDLVVSTRIVAVDQGVTLGPAPAKPPRPRRILTRFESVIVDLSNPVQPLLPDSPDRIRAVIQPHPPIGQANNNTSYGWIADSEAHAMAAARAGSGGAYVSIAATSHIPFVIEGTNAAWIALDSGSTTGLVIAVYADYYED